MSQARPCGHAASEHVDSVRDVRAAGGGAEHEGAGDLLVELGVGAAEQRLIRLTRRIGRAARARLRGRGWAAVAPVKALEDAAEVLVEVHDDALRERDKLRPKNFSSSDCSLTT